MDITKKIDSLVSNPKAVYGSFKEIGNKVYATKPTRIYVPARYLDRGLAETGTETYIVGIFAMSIDDKVYGTNIVNAMMQIEPTSFSTVLYNDEEYIEFYFEPGSLIFFNTELVKSDTLVYKIYDEIISKGNIPWYLDYIKLAHIFETAPSHANANIGRNREIVELIISLITRDSKDRNKYYRQTLKSMDDLKTRPPVYISMKNVVYAATNTLNKVAGSYMQDGIVSALVNPTERVERIDELLRQ